MKREKKIFYYVCFLFVFSMLSGCISRNVDTKPNVNKSLQMGEPIVGGELRIPVTQLDMLNPIINDNKSVYYLNKLIYDGLIRLDEKLFPQPALAKKWNVSENGKEWTFQLRDDVRWHDGKLFSAEDVKFTIDTLKMDTQGKKSIFSVYVKHIKNIKIINSHKISIEFDEAIDSSVEMFTFPIIPKHQFLNSKAVYDAVNIVPIGTGPYKVDLYDKFKTIKLVVNDDYWGDKPYITSILAKRVPDKEAALTSVEANEVDIAEATNFDWEKYSEDKSLKIYEYVTQYFEFLAFNFNKDILNDENIRKALAYSIDRHKIVDEVYLGHATIVDVPIYPEAYFYCEEEKKYGKDLLLAKKLLAESSWENRDNDKWLENESGKELRLRLLVNNDNPQRVKTAKFIASQLSEIGIDVVINKVDWEEYKKKILANKFDLVLGGWKLSNAFNLRFALHSEYIGNTNFIGYKNPNMDKLLDEVLVTKNISVKKEKYKQIQNLFVNDLPYFGLYFKNRSIIVKKHVKGDIMPVPFNIFNSIEKWYIGDNPK
ncbi:peptide ABC transporter substrate-binding protein [Crassaminicella thermophila]|uniref:Peptide ABC transporter substrate-binding protein n=1 Tax=Crassaminicella thermophila TaxID=2599308 RepID=A0A5C0SCR7_CRATE|nr:peptide ABC transporter substrate-binding protein [Crassaminicella thermophila]QEK12325.1 peptide ABC transporter substrate-binding protein [Crassaminicella thermophila]